MEKIDLVIIGGGPAGLAAAAKAYESGVRNMVILERDSALGGIYSSAFTTALAYIALERSSRALSMLTALSKR